MSKVDISAVRHKHLAFDSKACGAGHIGGGLSCLDTFNVLYNSILTVSSETFRSPDRVYDIQSKGHLRRCALCGPGRPGFAPENDLKTLNRYHSNYIGHPMRASTGWSKIPARSGTDWCWTLALPWAGKMDCKDYPGFTLLEDGELAEGSNWEAAMTAAHYLLDDLVAIVDRTGCRSLAPPRTSANWAAGREICSLRLCCASLRRQRRRSVSTRAEAIPFRPGKTSVVNNPNSNF